MRMTELLKRLTLHRQHTTLEPIPARTHCGQTLDVIQKIHVLKRGVKKKKSCSHRATGLCGQNCHLYLRSCV